MSNFWTKCNVGSPDQCWNAKNLNGKRYPQIMRDGHRTSGHRWAFYFTEGYWPEVVRHTCDNTHCWNPFHLVGGTQLDNVQDMMERGRHQRVMKSKLDFDKARAIRLRYSQGGIKQSELASEYGVTQSHISQVVRGVIWEG